MDPWQNNINAFRGSLTEFLAQRINRRRAQAEEEFPSPYTNFPVPSGSGPSLLGSLARDSLLSPRTTEREVFSAYLRRPLTPDNGPITYEPRFIDPIDLDEIRRSAETLHRRVLRRQRTPRLGAMDPPHEHDTLLHEMFHQYEFQCLLDEDVVVDIAKMEAGGTQYIGDFLAAHDVPKEMVKALNTFLHTFYLGTQFLGDEFRTFAGDSEPWKDGFDRWKYLERLARVHLWLKKEDIYKSFEEELTKLIEFALLDSTLHGAFVVKRMKDIKRWFAALREIAVKTLEDAKSVNVGIIGGRYGVQQIWTVAVLFLMESRQLKDKSSSLDGKKDAELIV